MSAGYEQTVTLVDGHSDLVARIVAGDREAEREFVQRFERGVRALVRRNCRPGDPIVDDLIQDVLTGVLERLRAGVIRDSKALPAYVQAAVVYATNAEYRRRKPIEPNAVVEHIADGETPASRAQSAQLASVMRELLAELPVARDREVLKRFYLDEQDKDSLCHDLSIDPSHFHRVVFRARERYRVLLEFAGILGTV